MTSEADLILGKQTTDESGRNIRPIFGSPEDEPIGEYDVDANRVIIYEGAITLRRLARLVLKKAYGNSIAYTAKIKIDTTY